MGNTKDVLHLTSNTNSDAEPKMLGALVPIDLYWAFKGAAGARKETMQEAMRHAALMYIESGGSNNG